MSFLTLRAVSRRYGAVAALDGVDFCVPAGRRTAIVGPSGSGKTTILRLVAGFEAPDAGRIVLDGITLADGVTTIPAHRRGVGVVTQDGALFPHLSIADNIGFGLEPGAPRTERIAELLAMVELDPTLLPRRPDMLSGGQQQRVALARALARKPKLMLLDEPFSALDTGLRASTRKAVATLLEAAGITTILVTHDQEEALSFADHMAVMGHGKMLQAGAPRDLYLQPASPMIAEFLGEAIILPAELAHNCATCALGRVAVADDVPPGAATIMLRPEQISLTACGPAAEGARAEIIGADFSGAVCRVSLRLRDAAPLVLRQSSFEVPPVGAIVGIAVRGLAYVFPRRAGGA